MSDSEGIFGWEWRKENEHTLLLKYIYHLYIYKQKRICSKLLRACLNCKSFGTRIKMNENPFKCRFLMKGIFAET